MNLIWLPARRIRLEVGEYKQSQHWLIDDDGRILACLKEPPADNPEDSFDVYVRIGDKEQAEFYSVDHAKAWAEREVRTYFEKKQAEQEKAAEPVTASVTANK